MDFLFTIAGFLTIISFGGGHERREESFEVDLDLTLNELGDGEDTQGAFHLSE
ncbi:uncharacterized protein LOC100216584 isoform 3 [Zea mays]|uniref:Uncharacterized protein n=1 Tax=Zea mays TaxID=4577 RepID=A0A1D6KEY1_MAIZE|nr:uncharacterized protein LOC100216584 isoform 3 [Zea mays]ONM01702.1 hypothetical protein ZEAMMB73_Zm00001d030902 [Zea mays]|eukprot:NP_001335708.1 uncharacterized protein LOC100216584 [Zea mays]